MIWQQPWAWAGLVTLAVPILIHLLGRGPARTQRFPTLQFIERSRLLPTRRTRLHDLVLLLVRMAVLALAVAAFAQPRWLTAARQRAFGSSMARLVIVDTSASVVKALGGASALRDSVDRILATLAAADNGGVRGRIETAVPVAAIDGAVAWLAEQNERREIVIVSDFQRSAISERDLSRIPSAIGIRLLAIVSGTAAGDSAILKRTVGDVAVRATARASGTDRARTDVSWSTQRMTMVRGNSRVTLLSGEESRARLLSAIAVAESIVPATAQDTVSTTGQAPSVMEIVLVAADAPERASLLHALSPPRTAWMLQLVSALRAHGMVQESAGAVAGAPADSTRGFAIAHFGDGLPAVHAAQDTSGDASRLVFLLHRNVSPVFVTALAAAVMEVQTDPGELAEYEPARLSENELASWSRESATTQGPLEDVRREPRLTATPGQRSSADVLAGDSDARWLWMGVLLLLVLETVLRRRMVRA